MSRHVLLRAVFLVTGSLPLFALPARAIPLEIIKGTVSDHLGRPIAGTLVSDGRQTVTTDFEGNYEIDESIPSLYTITVCCRGIVGESRVVTPIDALGHVDFTVLYDLEATTTPQSVSETPAALTISARSYAPFSPGCVTFTDDRTGTATALVYQSPTSPEGVSTWTGTFTVPAGTPPGSHNGSIVQTDCHSVVLTNVSRIAYAVTS